MSLGAQVTELLAREAQAIAALKQLLDQEYQSVRARDGAALEAATGAKRELIEKLEGCAGERAALLKSRGLPPGAAGFEALLAQLGPQREGAEAQWQSVREQLQACHKQNQVNGLMLDASLRATHDALAVLLGHGRENDTYDATGAINANRGARTYAKA